jgi:hypothetical protein
MAFSTVAIGLLPTYNVGRYTAGLAAPIMLALLRLLQGLAMGGEFGSAIIYISELANPGKRGFFVAMLQSCVNVGMILATLLVVLLQNTLSEREFPRTRALGRGAAGEGGKKELRGGGGGGTDAMLPMATGQRPRPLPHMTWARDLQRPRRAAVAWF